MICQMSSYKQDRSHCIGKIKFSQFYQIQAQNHRKCYDMSNVVVQKQDRCHYIGKIKFSQFCQIQVQIIENVIIYQMSSYKQDRCHGIGKSSFHIFTRYKPKIIENVMICQMSSYKQDRCHCTGEIKFSQFYQIYAKNHRKYYDMSNLVVQERQMTLHWKN